MIQNRIFVILFLKILYSPTLSNGHHHSFFVPDFLAESLKANNKNQQERSLILQLSFSRNLTHITNLNSLDIENNMLSKHLSYFTDFPANMFLFGIRKNICDSLTPRSAFLKHFESKCLHIYVYLPEKMFVPKTQ